MKYCKMKLLNTLYDAQYQLEAYAKHPANLRVASLAAVVEQVIVTLETHRHDKWEKKYKEKTAIQERAI